MSSIPFHGALAQVGERRLCKPHTPNPEQPRHGLEHEHGSGIARSLRAHGFGAKTRPFPNGFQRDLGRERAEDVYDCPWCGDGDALRGGEACAYCGREADQ